MNLTAQEYNKLVEQSAPKSKTVTNCLKAFCVGGGICTAAEFMANMLVTGAGMPKKDALSMASFALIFVASLLTGLNVFDKIAKFSGAGTLVPIIGFSNAMTASALEFKSEGFIAGLGAKMFSIAGPVIVYGVVSSMLYGLIAYLFRLY